MNDKIEIRSPSLLAIVSLISAFAVFVHAALGCCAHHLHAGFGEAGCQGGHGSFAVTEFADHEHGHSEADCGEHTTAVEDSGEGEKHEPSGGDCGGARCVGICVIKTPALDAADGVWAAFFTAPQAALTGRDSVPALWQMGHSFAPPVRRHLAHCVLLI